MFIPYNYINSNVHERLRQDTMMDVKLIVSKSYIQSTAPVRSRQGR